MDCIELYLRPGKMWLLSTACCLSDFDPGFSLQYSLPIINLDHINNLTTDFGMIQFAKINQPDPESGYTIDDNARAMVAMCMHYESTGDINDLDRISTYLHFIEFCIQKMADS